MLSPTVYRQYDELIPSPFWKMAPFVNPVLMKNFLHGMAPTRGFTIYNFAMRNLPLERRAPRKMSIADSQPVTQESAAAAKPKRTLRSMTGYAQAQVIESGWTLRISIRSVNHRFWIFTFVSRKGSNR